MKKLSKRSRSPESLRAIHSASTKAVARVFVERLEGRLLLSVSSIPNTIFGTLSSSPSGIIDFHGVGYFVASGPVQGLYRSDGTDAGTSLVKEFSEPGIDPPSRMVVSGNFIYFAAGASTNNIELWKSDGTTAGTAPLKDLSSVGSSSPQQLTDVNGTLFFTADDESHGRELFKSDGTAAGTVLVKDIRAGAATSSPSWLTNVNGTLYFSADDGSHGRELWKSDGTAAGTVLVRDIAPTTSSSSPAELTNVNGTLFFRATDGTSGLELWKSDGTYAGTVQVKDINPGAASGNPVSLTSGGGLLYFSVTTPDTGAELWRSDGTAAGTALIRDVIPGAGPSLPLPLFSSGGKLYFNEYNGVTSELWVTDGTTTGTAKVFADGATAMTAAGGHVFFTTWDPDTGTALWVTDGTESSTTRLRQFAIGPNSDSINVLQSVGNTSFLSADDGKYGNELWKSDGTVSGTVLVKDIDPRPLQLSVTPLQALNGQLYVTPDGGRGLYKTDGTASGTSRITAGVVDEAAAGGGNLYFVTGAALWRTDGTPQGTVLVANLDGTAGALQNLTVVGEELYFTAHATGAAAPQLWKSDGTASGTVPVLPDTTVADPVLLQPIGSTLFFFGTDPQHGYELWKTDGTAGGTSLVKDINPGPDSSLDTAQPPVVLNGSLLFVAHRSGAMELWRSDGTDAGTTAVAGPTLNAISILLASPHPKSLIAFNNWVYFFGTNASGAQALFRTDGTAAGTSQLKQLSTASTVYFPGELTSVGNLVFFLGKPADTSGERDLWRTDGTPGGTFIVRSFFPGLTSDVGLNQIVDLNGIAYFDASDSTVDVGLELWRSDGTAAGTHPAADLNSGPGSSSPTNLTVASGSLFLTTRNAVQTTTLWSFTPPAAPPAAPDTVLATPGPGLSVSLSWQDHSSDEYGVRVERSLSGDFSTPDSSVLLPANTTSYSDALPEPDTTYYYRVVSLNAAGETPSLAAHVSTGPFVMPPGMVEIDPTATWSNPQYFIPFKHQLFFAANGSMYRTDGTTAVVLPGVSATTETPYVSSDGKLLMFYPGGGNSQNRLWQTDGTSQNTRPYRPDPSNSGGTPGTGTSPFPPNSVVVGSLAYYFAPGDPSTSRGMYLWRTDGTAAGTIQLMPSVPVSSSFEYFPTDLTAAYGTIYFFAQRSTPHFDQGGYALWKSDGTPEGTVMVKLLPLGRFAPERLTPLNGRILFDDGTALWATDGTEAGTTPLMPLEYNNDKTLFDFTVANHRLYFARRGITSSSDGGQPQWTGELWSSDGTAAGTAQVPGLPVTYPVYNASPSQLLNFYDSLYFVADHPMFTSKLFHLTPPPIHLDTPAAPSNLTITSAAGTEIRLAWTDNSDNEEGFRLERSGTADFAHVDETVTLPQNATSFSDEGLSRNQVYYYRVMALGEGGLSAPALSASAVTPAAPPDLAALAATPDVPGGAVNLTWTDPAGSTDAETSLTLQRSTRSDFTTLDLNVWLSAGTTTYRDAAVAPLTRYYYRIWSNNALGRSGTKIAIIVTPQFAPLTPYGLDAIAVSGTEVDLRWADGWTNTQTFVIERASIDGLYTELAQVAGSSRSYSDTGLVPDQYYSYRIYARNVVGNSDRSNIATTGTLPPELTTQVVTLPDLPPIGVTKSADFEPLFSSDPFAYFIADVNTYGNFTHELWRTDGTAAGTTLSYRWVASQVTGVKLLGLSGGRAYVQVDFGGSAPASHLWSSDGTPNGTADLAILFSNPVEGPGSSVVDPTDVNGTFYFGVQGPNNSGGSLYRSDGSTGGTRLVRTFAQGPSNLQVVSGALEFDADSAVWTTDGTLAGTMVVPGAVLSNSDPSAVTIGHLRYYTATDGLYVTDGTDQGTVLLKQGFGDALPRRLTAVGSKLAFTVTDTGADFSEVWITDGTVAGTTRLTRFAFNTPTSIPGMISVGGVLYFGVGKFGSSELWKSDLTEGGTVRVTSLSGGLATFGAFGTLVTFTAGSVQELWASDGTAAGTRQLTHLGGPPIPAHPDQFLSVGNLIYFVSAGPEGQGRLLWRTDGTEAGTFPLANGSPVGGLFSQNGIVYFTADAQLYLTDGTLAGTRLAGTSVPSPYRIDPPYRAAIIGGFYYQASDNNLFRTEMGTGVVEAVTGLPRPEFIAAAADALFVVAGDPQHGIPESLYKVSAGSGVATVLRAGLNVTDLNLVSDLVTVGNNVYFVAPDGYNGLAVWRSDGTIQGTAPVAVPFPEVGAASSSNNYGMPYDITDVGGVAYFLTSDAGPNGNGGVWRTDGTPGGTLRIRDFNPAPTQPFGPRPIFLMAAGGRAVYSDAEHLWLSDGTPHGTIQIDDLGTASDGSHSDMTFVGPAAASAGDRFFYSAAIPGGGRDLRVAFLTAPSAPSDLIASAVQPSVTQFSAAAAATPLVRLDWTDRSDNESGFVIERSSNSDFSMIDRSFFVGANVTSFTDNTVTDRGTYFYRVRAVDAGGPSAFSNMAGNHAAVLGRHIFYNHSKFDGNDPAANGLDDYAVAPDKVALLPGQTATFANYTSYSRGINGVMVDVLNLPDTVTTADFVFRMGNGGDPNTWAAAAAPTAVTIHHLTGHITRIEITWADNAIQNRWLQVTLRADAHTGITADDVFYFGNAIGDSGSGNTPTLALVNATDEIGARNDPHNFLNPATVTNAHDYNRDGKVDATDQILARNNGTNFLSALKLITAPTAAPAAAEPLRTATYLATQSLTANAPLAASPRKPLQGEWARGIFGKQS